MFSLIFFYLNHYDIDYRHYDNELLLIFINLYLKEKDETETKKYLTKMLCLFYLCLTEKEKFNLFDSYNEFLKNNMSNKYVKLYKDNQVPEQAIFYITMNQLKLYKIKIPTNIKKFIDETMENIPESSKLKKKLKNKIKHIKKDYSIEYYNPPKDI